MVPTACLVLRESFFPVSKENARGLFVYKYLPTTLMSALLSIDGVFQTVAVSTSANKSV